MGSRDVLAGADAVPEVSELLPRPEEAADTPHEEARCPLGGHDLEEVRPHPTGEQLPEGETRRRPPRPLFHPFQKQQESQNPDSRRGGGGPGDAAAGQRERSQRRHPPLPPRRRRGRGRRARGRRGRRRSRDGGGGGSRKQPRGGARGGRIQHRGGDGGPGGSPRHGGHQLHHPSGRRTLVHVFLLVGRLVYWLTTKE